jgi:hypothetical protein
MNIHQDQTIADKVIELRQWETPVLEELDVAEITQVGGVHIFPDGITTS